MLSNCNDGNNVRNLKTEIDEMRNGIDVIVVNIGTTVFPNKNICLIRMIKQEYFYNIMNLVQKHLKHGLVL